MQSMGEHQPYINNGETSISMEEEVEPLVPPSNGYPYWLYGERLGEWKSMQENQDGRDKTPLISTLKLNKLHILLHIST